MKVFVLEDDEHQKKQILKDLKDRNYRIHFFPRSTAIFEILTFSPDIIIQDYLGNKVINCYQW